MRYRVFLSFFLTVAPFVAAGHVDSLGKNLLVRSGQEPAFASIDEFIRLGRVRSNLYTSAAIGVSLRTGQG